MKMKFIDGPVALEEFPKEIWLDVSERIREVRMMATRHGDGIMRPDVARYRPDFFEGTLIFIGWRKS